MPFLKFFWREFKSDYSFNWFFVLCASLGIIGLLLVESFRLGVHNKVSSNAKNFIASDLSLSTRRALSEKEIETIENYLNEKKISYAKWIETYSLVTKTIKNAKEDRSVAKLVDLNFVTPEFPFYGGVFLEGLGERGPGEWEDLHASPNAWVSRDLAWELNAKVGDELKVGESIFVIRGIVTQDHFSSFRGFSLAPKVFISHNFLNGTELIKFGSTFTSSYCLKIPENFKVKNIQKELRDLIQDKQVKINGPEESSQQVSRALNILTDYLSLITLMTYLLSLVGLYYFSQHFLSKKIKTFSIYKAIGLKNSFLFKISFSQLVLLTLLSLFISTVLILISLPALQLAFLKVVGEEVVFRLNYLSLVKILTLSFGGSLMSLGPLFWGALQAPVAAIFQDFPMELKRIKYHYFIPLLLYVVFLAVLLANSFKVGGYFLFSLAGVVILSIVFFKLLTMFFEKLSDSFSFVNKHAAKTLSRHFTSSFTIFICLLLGATLAIFILQLEYSLRQEFTQTHGNRRPDLFLFDLQENQVKDFLELIEKEKWNRTTFAPMVRGRLLKINEEVSKKREEIEESNFASREEQSSAAMKNRGVNLSYRAELSWSETVVEGRFNGNKCHPEIKICEISLEQSYARRMGVKLGDRLKYEVSGIEIDGVVTNLRTVKWTSFEPNFFILFQPGILEEAPKTYLTSFKTKSSDEKRIIFSKIAENFPTVSLIDVSDLVRKIVVVFDLMAMAIRYISFLSLFVALIVLVAVSFNHLDLRKREMGLFYMLGLKARKIKLIYVREFNFLICTCILLSFVFGSALTAVIMKFIFNTQAVFLLKSNMVYMSILGGALSLVVNLRVKYLLRNKNLF